MNTRFQIYFPFASKIFGNPLPAIAVLFFAAVPAALLSVHYSMSLVCLAASVYMGSTQRRFIDYILLTPVNVFAFYLFTGPSLGVSLVTYANQGAFNYGFFVHQAVSCVTALIAMVCVNHATRRLSIFRLPLNDPQFARDVLRPLILLGWVFFSVAVMQMIVGAVTGAGDRGYFGEEASVQFFGPWSIFAVFPRLTNVGFFLLPLMFFRSSMVSKGIIIGMFAVYFLFAFASGSRGAFIFPLFYISCGIYLFSNFRAVKMDVFALIGFCILAPLFVIVNEFRTSAAFQESRLIDIGQRLSALADRNELDHLKREAKGAQVLGGRLITVHDFLVYEKTPGIFPHVGFEGLGDFYWVWVPYFFARNRPIQQDAYFIALQYREIKYNPRSRNRVSFNADLYRRFSWPGIVVGNVLFFSLFGLFYRKVFDILYKRNALLGILLILYTFSYFSRGPTNTVMETWWQWAYEFPKHLVPILAIYYASKWFLRYRPRGLFSYKMG